MIITDADPVPRECRGGAAAIGNFDGVHRGHQALLAEARRRSEGLGGPMGLITFEPHPRSFFRPDEPVFRLSGLALKARLAEGLGARFTAAVTFDRGLANLEAEAFVEKILVERLGIRHLVTGPDFHFGHGRRGNTETLRRLGEANGFTLSILDQVTGADGLSPFSSSSIRTALRHGHVEAAGRDLGYWWTVIGEVVEGDKRGRAIGFPTANIVLQPGVDPKEGIYAMRVRIEGSRESLCGAGYVGMRPTFATNRRFLEVHLLDFSGDLYGKRLTVDFIGFIRPDRTFSGVEPLVAQMREDCAAARQRYAALQQNDPLTEFPLGRLQAEGRL
ncbi:MAG: bifunctional riboflavin kinase/FAD synthetase [Parvibaculaceae bacterium]